MTERNRVQLVVALGEGEAAENYRRALDEKAAEAGLKVTVWARRTLLRAASVIGEEDAQLSRREFEDLRRRVAELEFRTVGVTSHRESWLGCSPDCASHSGFSCDCGFERRKRAMPKHMPTGSAGGVGVAVERSPVEVGTARGTSPSSTLPGDEGEEGGAERGGEMAEHGASPHRGSSGR